MQNEFYCVEIFYDLFNYNSYYFKDKDKAFTFLWEQFLLMFGDAEDSVLHETLEELNETYTIDGFGCIKVCGFED